MLLLAVAGFGAGDDRLRPLALVRALAGDARRCSARSTTSASSSASRSLLVRTPDEMRGRVGAVHYVFIGISNELGGFESGVAAALFGPVGSVVGGGDRHDPGRRGWWG